MHRMKNTVALVLAAGRGTRMKSDTPKVLHDLLGKPLIAHVLDSLKAAGVGDAIVVTGYGSDLLKEKLKGLSVQTVLQKELLGSGDAVNTAKPLLEKGYENVIILCGDAPLIKPETIRDLIEKHKTTGSSATILTAVIKDPTGYGRIVRDGAKRITKIVEETEAGFFEEVIEEINSGIYCFKVKDLFEALSEVKPDNGKKEYFLTDVFHILYTKKKPVESVAKDDEDEIIGINSRSDLAEAVSILKKRTMEALMDSGVTIQDPLSTVIYPGAKIGRDSVIYSNTVIDSDVEIGERCHIGPFTRIRPAVRIGNDCEVGNFVELVRTTIGDGTKVKHHTYLGDTAVGKKVNIGAGTITANYDGKNKNRTVIEDGAFLGIGTRLVAPVKVGKDAKTGAGAVVLKGQDVPPGATVAGVPAKAIKK
jgi:bifunctional UDP-N-acetylglucosamine pyrophosphorylase / glucosamine-1-phosphate N-acetyltransferase